MKIYVLYRLLSLMPILFIVSIIAFFIIHLTPGNPAAAILGSTASEEEIAKLSEELGLNDPIYVQYLEWTAGVFKGDLGDSIFMHMPVTQALMDHFVPTLLLSIYAQVIAILIAIPLGIMAAKSKGGIIDQLFSGIALMGIAVPSFLIGLLLIMFFAVYLGWLPSGGYQPISSGIWNHFKYMLMPALTLGLLPTSLIARITRSSVIEVLSEDFIKTALSKGVKNRVVIFKHVLRNALIPIITVIGQTFVILMGGAVITETIFNIPGIGQLVLNSVLRRDYQVIQGALLLIATCYVFINLIVDLLYGLIDPRVRLNSKE